MTTPTANIASYLPAMVAARPEALAVAFPRGRNRAGKQRYLRWTYRQLEDESNIVARGLASIGITRGMHTVLMVKPSPEFFACVFALFKLGAVMIGIDPGMGVKNLKTCLAEAQPEAFIGIRKAHIARMIFGWAKATNRINVLVGRKLLPFGKTVSLGAVRAHGVAGLPASHSPVLANTQPDETAAILFTSGSTGVPKGVVYSHANFVAQVRALRDCYGIQPGEVDLCTFPLFALYAPALGMSAIVPEMDFTKPGSVDPRNVIETILEFNVTNMFGSPALLKRISGSNSGSDNTKAQALPCLGSLRRVISAGAPVPSRTIARITQLLAPGVQVFTPYGATETLPVCSIGSDEILGETAARTDQGKGVCIGRPVADIELKIVRISDDPIPHWAHDLELPTGEVGEIVVRGPQVTRSYFNRDQSTRLAKIHLGAGSFYHRMGDVGYLDEKGRVWFCGRKSERIVTTNSVYYTAMAEGMLNAHPGVSRSALVGVRISGKMTPVFCFEPTEFHIRNGLGWKQLLAALINETSPLLLVTRYFLRYPRPFPTDIRHNSKINRPLLAQWAAKQLGGRPS